MATYCCSDLHGFKSIYDKINAFIKPEDEVIFLGDAADRGPHGWEIIKDLVHNKQWIWVRGNHDEMLAESIIGDPYNVRLHMMNGGKPTREAMQVDTENPALGFSYIEGIANYIMALPTGLECENDKGEKIYLCHSGAVTKDPYDRIWDRSHYMHGIREDEPFDWVIHGHTPAIYLLDDVNDMAGLFEDRDTFLAKYPDVDENHAYIYQGHKVDLDHCTVLSHKTVLLNLDTFEDYVFEADPEEYSG